MALGLVLIAVGLVYFYACNSPTPWQGVGRIGLGEAMRILVRDGGHGGVVGGLEGAWVGLLATTGTLGVWAWLRWSGHYSGWRWLAGGVLLVTLPLAVGGAVVLPGAVFELLLARSTGLESAKEQDLVWSGFALIWLGAMGGFLQRHQLESARRVRWNAEE